MTRITELMAREHASVSFNVDNVWYEMSYATLRWIERRWADESSQPNRPTNRQVVQYIHQNLPMFSAREHNPTGKALHVYITRA